MLSVGDVIGGKYRIVRTIGEGGMGTVYEARHEVLGSHVALKFLHPEIARQPGLEQRFMQEAKLSATIANPHIARVTDVDTTEQGAYLVMELLRGEPLSVQLERETRFSTERAVEFSLQILAGLQAAHDRGVVHRDLKPDNVFVTPGLDGPLLKLLDFGIAKLRVEEGYQMTLTRPGAVMGTPEYMAPEQAYSADLVDQRSDIYSVGIMLFEMLSGKLPAEGDSPQDIAQQAIKGELRDLGQLCPELPPGLVEIVRRAMRPNPEDRWPNAAQMRAALLAFAPANRASSLPAASRMATGAATPFVPVSLTPRVDSVAWDAATVQNEERASNVPRTLPPMAGPPLATTQTPQKAKTASMPEVGQMVATPRAPASALPPIVNAWPTERPTPGRARRSAGWLWLVIAGLLAGISVGGWYAYDEFLDVGPTPPPQPTRRVQAPTAVPDPIEPELDEDDFDEDPPAERPETVRPSRPSPVPSTSPSSPVMAIPTFQLPTNLPLPTALPTVLPTAFPTSFPFPVPIAPTG